MGVGRGKAACRKVLYTEKPKVPGVLGVNPQGLASGVFFCGVCITGGSMDVVALQVTTTMLEADDMPRGLTATGEHFEGDVAREQEDLATAGEAAAATASFLVTPPTRTEAGRARRLPRSLGRARPYCWSLFGDGVGTALALGEGVAGKGDGAREDIESAKRAPNGFAVMASLCSGDGVGGKGDRVGDSKMEDLQKLKLLCGVARKIEDLRSAERDCCWATLVVNDAAAMLSLGKA